MRIFSYFFVGGIAAFIDIGLFTFFSGYLGWPWLPVSIFTFIIATLINYFLSIKIVFESGSRHKKPAELIGVFTVSAIALSLNQLVLYILIEVFDMHLMFSKIVSSCIVFVCNYYGRAKFVFKL